MCLPCFGPGLFIGPEGFAEGDGFAWFEVEAASVFVAVRREDLTDLLQAVDACHGDFIPAELAAGGEAALAGDEALFVIDHHGVKQAEGLNAGRQGSPPFSQKFRTSASRE